MDSSGRLYKEMLTSEELKTQYLNEKLELAKKIEAFDEAKGPEDSTSITMLNSDQYDFFKSKGTAFRQLWSKRLSKGITADQALRLKAMIDEFVKNKQK